MFLKYFHRKKIGLALGSGGPRGLAHIGVLKTLVKNNVPIDFVAGTSAGALIGGMFCAGLSVEEIEQIVKDFNLNDFLKIVFDPFSKQGLIKGEKILNFLATILGKTKIEDLKIPFKTVTTDVYSGNTFVIEKGLLIEAIRASSSIPFLFEPFVYEDKFLIDGGSTLPVPVELVKKMGADMVIAVNLNNKPNFDKESIKNKKSIDFLWLSADLLRYRIAEENCRQADIIIAPNVGEISGFNLSKFINGNKIVDQGEIASKILLPEIQKKLKWF